MKESICRFLPSKNYSGNIKTVHFVYETDFMTLNQPFIRPIYYLHLVTDGEATIRYADKTERLTPGTLFFFFPAVPYEIDGDENFKYIYISFMGSYVQQLLSELDITIERSVFDGFSHLTDIWMNAIARINDKNGTVLSESILLYSLSFVPAIDNEKNSPKNNDDILEMLVDYVDTHFKDPKLTLKRAALIFSYSEKYLSHMFKVKMSIGFNAYLNKLRIQHACHLIDMGMNSVTEIAISCGYNDPLYFSKTFKKATNKTPTQYIQHRQET